MSANNNKPSNPESYSRYPFYNSESELTQTALSIGYWVGTMKVSISPKFTDNNKFDYQNNVVVYLNPYNAYMLYNEICLFQSDPSVYQNLGIETGRGALVSISNGVAEYGVDCPILTIRVVNPESGTLEKFAAYEFKRNFYYSIRNFDEKTKDFEQIYHDDIELEAFKTSLLEYYKAMSMAMSHAVVDNMGRMNTKLDNIAEKLGVDYKSSRQYQNNGSFFKNENNNSNVSFQSGTLDDINDLPF